MRRLAFLACAIAFIAQAARAEPAAPGAPAQSDILTPSEARVRDCIVAAAQAHDFPAALIVILLKVEGGRIGRVSQNSNGTVDIGPMQVNTIWVGRMARRWRTTEPQAYLALRDDFCANVEGGSWILRQALDESKGDLWNGVGIYHSHTPELKTVYLRKILEQALKLRDQAARISGASTPVTLARKN